MARLEAAGAVLIGALNMGEYAYDFTGAERPRRAVAQSARPRAYDRRLVGRVGRGGRGRPRADRARLRHQRLDPRAELVLRRLRPEADLWPAVARAHVSVRRRASITSARSRAASPISRWPTTRCSAATKPIRRKPTSRRCRRRSRLDDGVAGPAHRQARRLFRRGGEPSRLRGGRPCRGRAEGASAPSNSPRRDGRARPPISSPWSRARRCISSGCGRAPRISIRTFATA